MSQPGALERPIPRKPSSGRRRRRVNLGRERQKQVKLDNQLALLAPRSQAVMILVNPTTMAGGKLATMLSRPEASKVSSMDDFAIPARSPPREPGWRVALTADLGREWAVPTAVPTGGRMTRRGRAVAATEGMESPGLFVRRYHEHGKALFCGLPARGCHAGGPAPSRDPLREAPRRLPGLAAGPG